MIKKFLTTSIIIAGMFLQANASDKSRIASELLITESENDDINHNPDFASWNNCVRFKNPCFEEGKTEQYIEIPNGSILNCAGSCRNEKIVRQLLKVNKVPNPKKLTHSAIVINLNPKRLYGLITDLLQPGSQTLLSEEEGNRMLRELETSYHDIISEESDSNVFVPFVMESRTPFTQLHSLKAFLGHYLGNVSVRPLKVYVPNDKSESFFKEYIGKGYENFITVTDAVRGVWSLNSKEDTRKVFCSELAALFLKQAGVLGPDTLANNVMPEMFCSEVEEYDLLKGKALPEIRLKSEFPVEGDPDYNNRRKIFGCC